MKDSKNVYEILNYTDSNPEKYIKETLNDMEKQSLKNAFRRNVKQEKGFKKLKTAAAVAALLVLTLGFLGGTNLGKNVHAAAQSKIAEVSYSIGKVLGTEKDIEPYVNVVNQAVEVNGVEVKLSEVIIDKDELIFSLITDTNKAVDGICWFDWDIFINGKRLKNYGVAGGSGKMGDSQTVFSDIYLVEAKGIELNENLDIRIVLKKLEYIQGATAEKIKGVWKFEFTANGSELMANSYAQAVGYSFDIGEQSYTLEEYRCNPVNQKITGKIRDQSRALLRASYDLELRGHDNFGNEVVFYLASVSGEDLMFRSSWGLSEGDLPDEATWIALTPYAVKFPEESGKMSNDYEQVGEEFTIILAK